MQNFKSLTVTVLFIALACERIFIETYSIDLRVDIIGPENILSAGASLHLSARKLYRLGSEGVKTSPPFAKSSAKKHGAICGH